MGNGAKAGGSERNFRITSKLVTAAGTSYEIDRDRSGDPDPHAFDLLSSAEVKLAVAGNHINNTDLAEQLQDALETVQELKFAMVESRLGGDGPPYDPGSPQMNLSLGNLDALPEVDRTDT